MTAPHRANSTEHELQGKEPPTLSGKPRHHDPALRPKASADDLPETSKAGEYPANDHPRPGAQPGDDKSAPKSASIKSAAKPATGSGSA